MDFREDADVRINHIQARGIILKEDKVLVMFRRVKGDEYYVFPGGHMREGEKPIETAVREIEEETTIKSKDLKLAFEYRNYLKKERREYYFVGYWESSEPILSGEESRRATDENYFKPMWLPLTDIPELVLYPLMAKEWVMTYLERFIEEKMG